MDLPNLCLLFVEKLITPIVSSVIYWVVLVVCLYYDDTILHKRKNFIPTEMNDAAQDNFFPNGNCIKIDNGSQHN